MASSPETIAAQSSLPLTLLEREIIKSQLNINASVGSQFLAILDGLFDNLNAPQRQIVRALIYVELPEYDADIAIWLAGGSDGVFYNPLAAKKLALTGLKRLLYPDASNDPTSEFYDPYLNRSTSLLQAVEVTYGAGTNEYQ